MHDMHYIQELVNVFEYLFEGLEVQLVWFIKKRMRGDGFQRWHQDLEGNGTTAETIVVNIASIVARDELCQIEKIRESHRLMEGVLLGSIEESQQKKGDDQERDTIGEVGQMCNNVGDSEFLCDERHDTIREIGLLSKDQKKTPEKLKTSCSNGHWDDQNGLPDNKHDTFSTVEVESELLKTPPEQLVTCRTYVTQDDVSDTFKHDGDNVGNALGNVVLDVDNQKKPPEELLASATTDQVIMSFVPSLPPMILPNRDQQDALQGIWICHNCDAHCLATNKRCGNCKKWRAGERETVGRSKKATTKNVKKSAPKVTSPAVAGHKRKEAPPATIAIASKNATTSPLTGLNLGWDSLSKESE
jgi:hypothetical protein